MHGKVSMIHHQDNELFSNINNPFQATRYHSLVIEESSLPDCLDIIAKTNEIEDDEIMAVKHVDYPVYGIQFHPESILTHDGMKLLENFLNL